MGWLEDRGWEFERAPGKPMKISLMDRRVYYLQLTGGGGGMNFGPQFRHMQIGGRVGKDGVDATALAVSGLPETCDWEMSMKYRPGILDVFNAIGLANMTEN